MSVGIVIITHDGVGQALLDTTVAMLGVRPLPVAVLGVEPDTDPDAILDRAHKLAMEIDMSDGVLVLTDLYGSTPSNVACALQRDLNVRVVAGLNMPMLLRVMNYPSLGLAELAEKALSGGRDGVMAYKDAP